MTGPTPDPRKTLDQQKRALRRAMAELGARPSLGFLLAGHLLEQPLPPFSVVSGFWPLPGEIDIRPLLLTLHGRGHPIVLPCTPPPGQALSFHRWRPGQLLVPGRMGILEPDAASERLEPDVLLVPLVAFDRGMRRLGHGAGYYDRTLALLRGKKRVLAIGIAFSGQEVGRVPADENDAPLDRVATENGVLGA